MTIKLYQFPTALGVPNLSPFCMKVEVWLRLAELPYEVVWEADPRKTPKGKMPYVVDGKDIVPDSHDIVAYLEKAHGVNLDAGLSAEQKAIALAFTRIIAEHLYWPLLYSRWVDPAGWPTIRKIFFGHLPAPQRMLVPNLVQRQIKRDLRGQGMGRHKPEEIYARAAQDLQALADFLGSNRYFMGDKPTNLDASAYAFLGNIWEVQLDTPLKPLLGKHRNLVAYCARMRERCFPTTAEASRK